MIVIKIIKIEMDSLKNLINTNSIFLKINISFPIYIHTF